MWIPSNLELSSLRNKSGNVTKKIYTKFDSAFQREDLEMKLSGLTSSSVHSFTKKNNLAEFNNLLTLLPSGYVDRQKDNIELIDLVYSGSTSSPYLLTLIVGRNDTFREKEKFDIDVLNIAPDTGSTGSYFSMLWHHFKDDKGNRSSYDIHPFKITDEETRKNVTYSVFLTGSTTYYDFEDYQKEKPDFLEIHSRSFGELKK